MLFSRQTHELLLFKNVLRPCPRNKIKYTVPIRVPFKISQKHLRHFYMGVPAHPLSLGTPLDKTA